MLDNPPCRKAGYCLTSCGCCDLNYGESRFIHAKSLFGDCRAQGKCTCKLCKYIAAGDGERRYEAEVLYPKGKKYIPNPKPRPEDMFQRRILWDM